MLFSVIIPIYNAEKTLEFSINSVLRQTYSDWELILVDDCSTDNSYEKGISFTKLDLRVKAFRMPSNSGNAKRPCDEGIKQAKGQFCIILDNDDELIPDYLQIMADIIRKYAADVVLPIMVSKDSESKLEIGRISKPQSVCEEVIDGISACRFTLPDWNIGCNGMAFKRSLYQYVLEKNPYNYAYSDEFSERLMLYYAKSVAFSNAEYIYWQHNSSITHKKSPKLYEILCVDKQLLDFAQTHYDNEIVTAVFHSMLCHLMILQKDFYRDVHLYSTEEKNYISTILHLAFDYLSHTDHIYHTPKERLLMKSPMLFRLICRIKK